MSNRFKHNRMIDREVEVYIQNNTHGTFYWESMNHNSFVKLDREGEEDVLTFGELRGMVAQLRPLFVDMSLIISEVNDPEISIMDVANELHIGKTYENFFDKIMDIDFGKLEAEEQKTAYISYEDFIKFAIESDIDDFKKVFETELKNTLIAVSVDIYRNKLGELSYEKMTTISKERNDSEGEMWKDISASLVG